MPAKTQYSLPSRKRSDTTHYIIVRAKTEPGQPRESATRSVVSPKAAKEILGDIWTALKLPDKK